MTFGTTPVLLSRSVMYVTTAYVGKTSMTAVLIRGRKDSVVAIFKVQYHSSVLSNRPSETTNISSSCS
jgi:hypothetical protein